MSQENVETTPRMAEAFNSGGSAAIRPFLDPEIEWHEDPAFPEVGRLSGHRCSSPVHRAVPRQFADIRYEALDVIDEGENVIANIRIKGSGRASGVALRSVGWWAFTFRDGQVIRGYSYLDRDAALAAVGLTK